MWGSEFKKYSPGPVSRELAIKSIGLPLPETAYNIEYAIYSSGQSYEMLCRFESPLSDCFATAQLIFSKARSSARDQIPHFEKTHHPIPPPLKHHLQVGWFNIKQINKGVTAGDGYGVEPQIWIDEDRAVFYYYIID